MRKLCWMLLLSIILVTIPLQAEKWALLIGINNYPNDISPPRIEKESDELFQIVMRYEKLRLTLSRIRTKHKKEEKGIVNLQGKGKISGRKSYLEKDPELVRRVRKLRMSKYSNGEITKILFDLGYKTKTGKPFGRGMITRLYQQSELLPPE